MWNKFTLNNLNTIYEVAANLPDPQWYVQDILPTGFTVLGGKGKSGKSWFAMGAAVAVARGDSEYLGLPVRQANVLYLNLEEGLKKTALRFEKVLGGADIPANLYIQTQDDIDNWRYDTGAMQQSLDYVITECGVKVIIIDMLFRIMPSVSGRNEYEVINRFVSSIKEIIGNRDVAVMGLIHCGKADIKPDSPMDAFLGTSGWLTAPDHLAMIYRPYRSTTGWIKTDGKMGSSRAYDLSFDGFTWGMIGNTEDEQEKRERDEYNKKPGVQIVKAVLANTDTYYGTAKTIISDAGSNISPESFGRYMNRAVCSEMKERDGITVFKRRTSKGSEYLMTRNPGDALRPFECEPVAWERVVA